MEAYVLAASLTLQLVAAALAIAMIPTTRALWAWILIASALVLMTGRRAITLSAVLSGEAEGDMSAELVALVISISMVIGMGLIRPVFTRMRSLADELAERERSLTMMIEGAPDGIVLLRGDFCAYTNPALRRMLGHDPSRALPEQALRDLVHPDDRVAFAEPLENDTPLGSFAREVRFRAADGSYAALELAYGPTVTHEGAPARLLQARDLSERKRLQQQLIEASKLEAIGRLSGGIAHDFNNLLTIIATAAGLARARLDPKSPTNDELDMIDEATERAARLTGQLLTYARSQPRSATTFDLNRLVVHTSDLLRRLMGEDIRIDLRLSQRPVVVVADSGQIEQVILNLAINARDAMPQGGTLTIETLPDEAGGSGLLLISDDGHGIEPQLLPRIFEPFFTTKPVGKGTGLGLSSSYGIVTSAQGHIEVDSTHGKGTTFRVRLPAGSPDELAPPQIQDKHIEHAAREILLVEDEQMLARLACSVLRAEGYVVRLADSGGAALETLLQMKRAPDLLVTDVVMPGLNGPELVHRARARFPDIKVLFMTGYGAHVINHFGQSEQAVVLKKPFTAEQLARAVRARMDGDTEPSASHTV